MFHVLLQWPIIVASRDSCRRTRFLVAGEVFHLHALLTVVMVTLLGYKYQSCNYSNLSDEVSSCGGGGSGPKLWSRSWLLYSDTCT